MRSHALRVLVAAMCTLTGCFTDAVYRIPADSLSAIEAAAPPIDFARTVAATREEEPARRVNLVVRSITATEPLPDGGLRVRSRAYNPRLTAVLALVTAGAAMVAAGAISIEHGVSVDAACNRQTAHPDCWGGFFPALVGAALIPVGGAQLIAGAITALVHRDRRPQESQGARSIGGSASE